MPLCVKCGVPLTCDCGGHPAPLDSPATRCPLQEGAIWVHVTDDAGGNLARIDVSVDANGKATSPAGMATFDPLPEKSYTVALSALSGAIAERHTPPASTSERVAVSKGEITYVGFELQRKARLRVKAVQQGVLAKFFSGATVRATGVTGPTEGITDDTEGAFDFGWQATGTYPLALALKDEDDADFVRTGGNLTLTLHPGEDEIVYLEVRPRPAPKIEIAAPKLVLVRHAYHGRDKPGVKPHRLAVKLSAEGDFDGEGRFTFPADQVKVFEAIDSADDTAVASPYTVPRTDLAGKTVYVEAIKESAAVDGTTLTFALETGSVAAKPAATEKITCVKLMLEIYTSRPADGGEPAKLADDARWETGRAVLEQGTDQRQLWAERAKLVLRQALPADFAGKLILEPITAGVDLFAEAEEKPVKDHVALGADKRQVDNAAIDGVNGATYWVQGKTVSAKMADTGWKLGVEGVLGADGELAEGERVTMTVLKAELALHKSRTVIKASGDPAAFSNEEKLTEARYLHQQDGKGHHGRAMITVKKVLPADFTGKLYLTSWKVGYTPAYSETAVTADAPIAVFKEEDAAGATQTAVAFDSDIDHPADFPGEGMQLWVEGKKTSAELRDIQIRLGVREVDKGCDRGNLTVVRFKSLVADIPSTPANIVRNIQTGQGSNSPVARHELKLADPAPTDDDCSELFSENKPLVLIEGSVLNTNPVKLSVVVEPAGKSIPVRWSVQRFSHLANAEGDPDALINLLNNNADPGLLADNADPLKATLTLSGAGSFHVRPYIDCNGSATYNHNDDTGQRIDREPFLLLNLQLIRVQGVSNLTVTNNAAGTNGTGKMNIDFGGAIGVRPAPVNISTGDFARTGNDAITMRKIVHVTGGGPDGKRGLDQLFGGWCNNMANTATSPTGAGLDITHTYRTPLPLNAVHTTACWFELDGARIPAPILDAGAYGPPGSQGTGGNTATSTAIHTPPITQTDHGSGLGQSWELLNVDSPGFNINASHPSVADANLVEFRFNIDFRCDLIFWTNRDQASDHTDAAACRLYSTVSSNPWTVRFTATYDATFTETVVTGPTHVVTLDPAPNRRAAPVEGSGLETRCPDSLDNLKAHEPP
ncbi:MAG: hypothetical protein V4476_20645 [Pseudomonadota bacterium]